jgi:hypothetical protein
MTKLAITKEEAIGLLREIPEGSSISLAIHLPLEIPERPERKVPCLHETRNQKSSKPSLPSCEVVDEYGDGQGWDWQEDQTAQAFDEAWEGGHR